MGRTLDAISLLLIGAGGFAFARGVQALGDRKDLLALYLLIVGALCLKAATDMLRPRSGDA
jgi:hypothetical protein